MGFVNFDLVYFLSRYLAGGGSLREYRAISRKRISLVKSGITKSDLAAYDLLNQIERFYQSIKYLTSLKEITVNDLLFIHRNVLGNKAGSGKFRANQNWVGESISNAKYIPPTCDNLILLINEVIRLYNNGWHDVCHSYSNAVEVYSKFILAHPFNDGNGRCARVLFMSIFQEFEVSPILYRIIQSSQNEYYDAVSKCESLGEQHSYWVKSKDWSSHLNKKIQNRIYEYNRCITGVFSFYLVSESLINVINYVTNNPFFTPSSLLLNIQGDPALISKDLDFISELGLVKEHRNNVGIVFYECCMASALHDEIEKYILDL